MLARATVAGLAANPDLDEIVFTEVVAGREQGLGEELAERVGGIAAIAVPFESAAFIGEGGTGLDALRIMRPYERPSYRDGRSAPRNSGADCCGEAPVT